MARALPVLCALCAIFGAGRSVSTKLGFDDGKESSSSASDATNDDKEVEVKHTIVVSTKLSSNGRRGLLGAAGDGDPLKYAPGHESNVKDEYSSEVPIVRGYKSVESTIIRTPDSRDTPMWRGPGSTDRGRGVRYGTYPVASIPAQWKPSSFFNNVNWWGDDHVTGVNDFAKRNDWAGNRNQENFHRGVTDEGVKEFYCRKCRELSGGAATRRCAPSRNNWFYERTTPKVTLDGKLARFN